WCHGARGLVRFPLRLGRESRAAGPATYDGAGRRNWNFRIRRKTPASRHPAWSAVATRLAEVLEQVGCRRRLGEGLTDVGFRASEGLEHEDLLERAFLEIEDHRVPGC